ncbi:hypothetical protein [Desulfotruncus alcoholivorax]|uniref:hypothetical protein n=1 Tax=Desulfotruncus alcoholivorax TaxID=265477 RepID=UPI00041DB040|nr:hypothetical protein [Desulfotruncus alcoholivorax]
MCEKQQKISLFNFIKNALRNSPNMVGPDYYPHDYNEVAAIIKGSKGENLGVDSLICSEEYLPKVKQ